MKKEKAIIELNKLKQSDDPEYMHRRADYILLRHVDKSVKKAYEELVESARWWVHA